MKDSSCIGGIVIACLLALPALAGQHPNDRAGALGVGSIAASPAPAGGTQARPDGRELPDGADLVQAPATILESSNGFDWKTPGSGWRAESVSDYCSSQPSSPHSTSDAFPVRRRSAQRRRPATGPGFCRTSPRPRLGESALVANTCLSLSRARAHARRLAAFRCNLPAGSPAAVTDKHLTRPQQALSTPPIHRGSSATPD